MKIRKAYLRMICLALCLAMAFCASFGTLGAVAEDASETAEPAADGKITLVLVKKDIPMGTRITSDYIEAVTVKNGKNLPSNMMSKVVDVASNYARYDIFAGEYVSEDMLSTKPVNAVSEESLLKRPGRNQSDYLVVTEYLQPDTGEDLSTVLQKLIDANPNRVLYFPDGVYTIGYSLTTSAKGANSVSFIFSDGAVLKASDNFRVKDDHTALICLGGSESYNDIKGIGSYYCVMGGTLDGNGKADGIAIESGRESLIRNICIKNTPKGIHIWNGVNNSSSDCDFEDITIIGTGKLGTRGVRVEGCDNTFTNIRIFNTEIGLDCYRGGNLIKSVIAINNSDDIAASKSAIGIIATADNWVSECYVENYTTAYKFGRSGLVSNNTAVWTSDASKIQTAYRMADGTTSISLSGCKAYFKNVPDSSRAYVIGGQNQPTIEGAVFDTALENNGSYKTKLLGLKDGMDPKDIIVPVS